jgi:flavoprotein
MDFFSSQVRRKKNIQMLSRRCFWCGKTDNKCPSRKSVLNKKIRFHSKRICLVCAQYKKNGAIQKDLVADNEWSPYKSFF